MLSSTPRLGLKYNRYQFTLLILVNILVGGMAGLERTVVPIIGMEEFKISSDIMVFSFIITFGVVKAVTNLVSGVLADIYSRKLILVIGWLVALPVPFMLGWGPSWNWILLSNVLLGISQGLTWSMTLNMKIDLVTPQERGLAMGLNGAAGYSAVGLTAMLTGYLASVYGLRPQPFYIGIAYAVTGILTSAYLINDTGKYTRSELVNTRSKTSGKSAKRSLGWIFRQVSYKNKKLQAVTQAGLVNNMNDGMSWGVFPIFFMKMGVDLEEIGWIRAVYPLIWGLAQVVTGPLSDKIGRKQLIVPGMFVQAGGLFLITGQLFTPLTSGLLGSVLLGIGTAMVYPTLMAVVSDSVHPARRASSLGVYRFWRDMGYAVGALFAGITANMLGFDWTIRLTAIITALSGIYVWVHLKENKEQTTA